MNAYALNMNTPRALALLTASALMRAAVVAGEETEPTLIARVLDPSPWWTSPNADGLTGEDLWALAAEECETMGAAPLGLSVPLILTHLEAVCLLALAPNHGGAITFRRRDNLDPVSPNPLALTGAALEAAPAQ